MKLTPMRYKDYTWPHNPETCRVELERRVAVQKVPFGGYVLQDLGLVHRVMRGEGVFVGENAYEKFRELAQVFEEEGAGMLVHPVWRAMRAWFTALEVVEEPKPDYVRYSFEFWEDGSSTGLTLLSAAPETENDGMTENGGTAEDGGTAENGSATETEPGGKPETENGGVTETPVETPVTSAEYHTVVKGETLWGIGKKYGVTLNSLIQLNPQIKNPNLIYPGNEVRIR